MQDIWLLRKNCIQISLVPDHVAIVLKRDTTADSKRHLLCASLCHLSCGPSFTYCSVGHHTAVNYCLLDCQAAHLLQECKMLDHFPLNISDHLPVSLHLDLVSLTQSTLMTPPKINWKSAKLDGSITFQQLLSGNFLALFHFAMTHLMLPVLYS